MSRFDVHPRMRTLSAADARDEMLLDGSTTEPALSDFLTEVRLLASAPAPQPTGALAVLLRDGFEPEPEPARVSPPASAAGPVRRWSLRAASAATALATTFGGMAAAGALPDPMQQWASDAAERVNVTIPAPDPAELRERITPTAVIDDRPSVESGPGGAADGPERSRGGIVTDTRDSGDSEGEDRRRADGVEDRRDAAQDAADDRRDAQEDAADDRRDAEEDAADDRADAEEDAADQREDAADDEADAAEDAADARADAAREAREAAEEEADAAEDAADNAEDAADEARDTAREREDD